MTNSTASSRSLTSASRLTDPGVIPRCLRNRSGDAKPSLPGAKRRPERIQVDREIVRHRHQEMARTFLVAQEQVLGLGARQLRHQALGLLDRHHRRVRVARRRYPVLAQEGVEIHPRTS